MTTPPTSTIGETGQQKFERLLSQDRFKGLKAILDRLTIDRLALWQAVNVTNSYQGFLTHLGYGLTLTKQIHVQDCYSRLGAAGGIRAVLPYNDIPTQGTMHTLVNVNSTVTTTPKAAGFFNEMLARFKVELGP